MYTQLRPFGEPLPDMWPSCGLQMVSSGLKQGYQTNGSAANFDSNKYFSGRRYLA